MIENVGKSYEYSRHGRVVKASDSKSDSILERRFESYCLRIRFWFILIN